MGVEPMELTMLMIGRLYYNDRRGVRTGDPDKPLGKQFRMLIGVGSPETMTALERQIKDDLIREKKRVDLYIFEYQPATPDEIAIEAEQYEAEHMPPELMAALR